jgi:hypothetical protein
MALDERFQAQAQAFITETLNSEIPSLNVDNESAVNMILAKGGGVITATLLQEIDNVVNSRDISDPEAINEAEMDVFLANLFAERDDGAISRGFVEIHFEVRTNRSFAQGTRAATADRVLTFATPTDLEFSPEAHHQDPSDGSYYIRVPFVAEDAGDEYDVDPGEIIELVDSGADVLYVTNRSAFFGGIESQTNTEAVRSARRAVSTRTQIDINGAIYVVEQLFGQKMLDVLVIGNGDEEMLRDEMYDQGEGSDPRWTLGPAGTASGVHVGGRSDIYNWYRTLNYVEETVDIFGELLADSSIASVHTTIDAVFVAGTTGTVSATGKLTLEIGSTREEVISYSSFSYNALSGVYTFTLIGNTVFAHAAGTSVRVSNTGRISVAEDGEITVLPLLQIASVRVLDPVTFEPIGDPVPETTELSREPGWYLDDHIDQNHMSAKETKTLVLDEKATFQGNPAGSGTGDVAPFGGVDELYDPGFDFTGYQGREVELVHASFGTVTRTIIGVLSTDTVQLNSIDLGVESGVTWTIEAITGEYNQYPVRVSFYTHTEIQELQDYLDDGRNRITTSDIFSRAFFPVFVDFTLRYKGDGAEDLVRDNILNILQNSAGEAIGDSVGAKFDYSDLVAAAYADNLANYVETPFEVKVTRVNVDGSLSVSYVNPGPDTVNSLSLDGSLAGGEVFVEAERPASVAEFTMPAQGLLYLGAFTGTAETLEYIGVIQDGSSFIFVLRDGQVVSNAHSSGELLQVSVLDYDPDSVITDGVITDERQFRPYLGTNAVIEKIE